MIRKALPSAAMLLWACAEPPPPPHANGAIVVRAVELAQARADQGSRPAAADAASGR